MDNNSVESLKKSKDWGARFLGDHLEKLGVQADCVCHNCLSGVRLHGWLLRGMVMILCPTCGNKRCPKAEDHRYKCTGSNEPGQVGVTE